MGKFWAVLKSYEFVMFHDPDVAWEWAREIYRKAEGKQRVYVLQSTDMWASLSADDHARLIDGRAEQAESLKPRNHEIVRISRELMDEVTAQLVELHTLRNDERGLMILEQWRKAGGELDKAAVSEAVQNGDE